MIQLPLACSSKSKQFYTYYSCQFFSHKADSVVAVFLKILAASARAVLSNDTTPVLETHDYSNEFFHANRNNTRTKNLEM